MLKLQRLHQRLERFALGSVLRCSSVAPISLMERLTAATEQTRWAGAVVPPPQGGLLLPKLIAGRQRPWVAAARLVWKPPPAQPATEATRKSSMMRCSCWEIVEGKYRAKATVETCGEAVTRKEQLVSDTSNEALPAL